MSYRLSWRLLVLIGAWPFALPAQTAAGSAEGALVDADAARIAAFVSADAGKIAPFLADELSYVHSTGMADGKAALLGKMKSGELVYQSIKTHNVVAHVYGRAGVVTATADVTVLSAQKPRLLALRYTATYAMNAGHWQLVAYESTLLPAAP